MRDYGQRRPQIASKAHQVAEVRRINSRLLKVIAIALFVMGMLWAGQGVIQHKKVAYLTPGVDEDQESSLKSVGEMLPVDRRSNSFPDEVLQASVTVDELKVKIQSLTDGAIGRYGWYVQSLVTGSEYGDNHNFSYTAASVNKVPIVLAFLSEVENGSESLTGIYQLNEEDKEDGTGSLQYQPIGTEYSYGELIQLIGKESDNTAVNALVSKIGSEKIQSYVDRWGMNNTNLLNNTSTPREMGELFGLLYHNRVVKASLRETFFTSLTDTNFEDRIPAGVPDDVRVVHKIGNQIQVWNDCGVVFAPMPYTLCIMTDETSEEEAQAILPAISRLVWEWETRLMQ